MSSSFGAQARREAPPSELPDVQDRVRDFIVQNFYVPAEEVEVATPLVERGIIDSTGILEVISFLESEFGIRIRDEETIPDHLGTIERIAAFVVRKRASGT
jgi:acyl carrier protein